MSICIQDNILSNILKAEPGIVLMNVVDISMNNSLLKLWIAAYLGINILPTEYKNMIQTSHS